jgi:hypothetical protein
MFEPMPADEDAAASIFVIVAARTSRRESLRTLIASIESHCLVEMAPSASDIALLPLASEVDVLVLDLEFETRECLALIPLLAKRRPNTAIIALYNVMHQAPIAGCQIWPWHQAEKALRRTLHGVAAPATKRRALDFQSASVASTGNQP